jgi:hypothetical protein
MKTVLIIGAALASAVGAVATQWGPPKIMPNVNSSFSGGVGVTHNGDYYKIVRSSATLYRHSYLGSYRWSSDAVRCTGVTPFTGSVDPSGKQAFFTLGGAVCHMTSDDGLHWYGAKILRAWDRTAEEIYPQSISCAWRASGRWLYVVYDTSPGSVWAGPEPYNAPRPLTLPGARPTGIAVRHTGDYMVICSWEKREVPDLFELRGFGSVWGSRKEITEVSKDRSEYFPLLGTVEGKNILIWLYDGLPRSTYYSVGAATPGIDSTSLGRVKALFK